MWLKLNTVLSDGTTAVDPVRRVAFVNPRTGQETEAYAEVRCRSFADWRQIQRAHTSYERNPQTRAMEAVVDEQEARLDLLVQNVRAWSGVVGYDEKPVALCPAAVRALDYANQVHLATAILENEAVSADSFR